jgi:hypothetical protein
MTTTMIADKSLSLRTAERRITGPKRPKSWPLGIHPVAMETMRRMAAGEPVTVRKPSAEWLESQFQKLYGDGSFLIPALAQEARRKGLFVGYGELWGKVFHDDGTVTDYGLLGRRVITDAGVAYLTADMNNNTGSSDITNFKYHGFGTGTTAENANQTALVTELTTEYVSNSTRPTGSQANSTNTYTTAGTLAPDSGGTLAITEHGVFSATSSTTLWDRTVFSAINLVAGSDSLVATYVATFPSGS